MDDKAKLVKKEASELLKLMGVDVEIDVSQDEENDALVVDIDSEEHTGLLIGNRGDTINSIQMILGLIIRNKTDDWQRILVNVADWRERQEDRLTSLAKQTAERAIESGNPQPLYNLSPSDRRVVHMVLSEDDRIETKSEGEGRDRYLLVSPKTASEE